MSYLRNELAHHNNNQLGQWQALIPVASTIFSKIFGGAPKAKPRRFAAGFGFKTGITPTYGDVLNALNTVVSTSKEGAYSLGNVQTMAGKKGVVALGSGGYKGHSRDTMNLVSPTRNSTRALAAKINMELNKLPADLKKTILSKPASISPGEQSLTLESRYLLPGYEIYLMGSGQGAIQQLLQSTADMFIPEINAAIGEAKQKDPTPTTPTTTPTTPTTTPNGQVVFFQSPTVPSPTETMQPTVIQEAGLAGGPLFWVAIAVGAGLFIMQLGEDKPKRKRRR